MELEDLAALSQEKGRGRFSNSQKLTRTIRRILRAILEEKSVYKL